MCTCKSLALLQPEDLASTRQKLACANLSILRFLSPSSPARTAPAPEALSGRRCACSVTKSCPALCDPMDCSPPGSSIYGIFWVSILEWVAMPSSRGSSQSRDRTCASCINGRILHHGDSWEAPGRIGSQEE